MKVSSKNLARILLIVGLISIAGFIYAQQLPLPKVSVEVGSAQNRGDVNAAMKILALLTVLSLVPAILMLTTAFSRIVIILSFVRTALGTQQIPPNQVLVGLALFLTFFVMGPTYSKVNDQALQPYFAGTLTMEQAIDKAQKPLRDFMLKNTYEKDLLLFVNIRKEKPKTRDDISMMSLIPAFITSELKTAFIIGFYVLVPFIIIDLIVASALMSMGMMMLPPTVVSLPAKILVFVLADGWGALVAAIMAGYS